MISWRWTTLTLVSIVAVVAAACSGDPVVEPLPAPVEEQQTASPPAEDQGTPEPSPVEARQALAADDEPALEPQSEPEPPDDGRLQPLVTSDAAIPGNALTIVGVADGDSLRLPVAFGPSSWSPDASVIAVGGDNGLALVDIETLQVARYFSDEAAPIIAVAWHPDGSLIALANGESLRVLDLNAGTVETLSEVEAFDLRWSPDGKALAYRSGPSELVVWRVAELRSVGDLQDLIDYQWMSDGRIASVVRDEGNVLVLEIWFLDEEISRNLASVLRFSALAIAPDGSTLAGTVRSATSVTTAAGTRPQFDVRIEDVMLRPSPEGGTGEIEIVNAVLSGQPGFGPSYSPDGTRLLLQASFCSPDEALIVFDLAGDVLPLASAAAYSAHWSPDGRWVAYTVGTELYAVVADGSGAPRLLATDVHAPLGATWSPDSRWVSFTPFIGGYGRCE